MCKIVILEPKERTRCTKSSASPPLPIQEKIQEKGNILLIEKKAEKKDNDQKATSALPPPSINFGRCDLKKTDEIKRSVHDVVHNKLKNQKKSKKENSSEHQQHIVPKAIQHTSVTRLPTRSRLPRNVRFAIDDNQYTESSSTDSISSDDSYTDSPKPTIPNFYPDSDDIRTPWEPPDMNGNRALYIPEMMEDAYSIESDTSSRIDVGETTVSAFSPEWEGNFETQGPPIQQTIPLAPKFQSLYDGKTPLELSNHMSHNLTWSNSQAGTEISPKFGSDHEWDSDSDQESAIDCNELDFPMQVMNSNIDKKLWGQNQDSHADDGFNDWLERLDSPSPQTLSFEGMSEPLFVYRHRGNEPATSEIEPIFVIKKRSNLDQFNLDACNGINADFTSAYNDPPPDMMNVTAGIHSLGDHKDEHVAMPSLYRLPTFIDVENPTQFNPGLGIYWRDV